MLNALREKTQGLMGMALLVILVVPFVLWGVSSYFGGSSTLYVARGHGVRITAASFQHALGQQRAALEHAYGSELNPAVLGSRKFKKSVLEGLINRALLLRDAKKAGYTTNRVEIAEEIRQIPAFRVHDHFSAKRYRALLSAQGFTVPRFERRISELTLLNQVKVGLLASAFVPTPTLNQAVALLSQRRTAAYVILSPRKEAKKTPVTTAEVNQYYKQHLQDFRSSQKVRIAYLVLSPQAVMRAMHGKVSMAALQKAYQAQIQQFTQPAERLVRHIMVALPAHPTSAEIAQAKGRLLAISKALRHGASFALMAKRDSQDTSTADNGGSLGFVTKSELSKPVAQVVFGLPLNKISAPVVGRSGVHLLEVTAVHPAVVEPFSAVKAQLTRVLLQREARKRLYHLSERLRNAAFEHPHSLAPAARKLGLTLHESSWFGSTGGTGIAAVPEVVKAVFAPKVLAGRRNTHAIPVGEDGILVAHVIAHKGPSTKPLQAVKAAIVKSIERKRAQDAVQREKTLLLAELNKGASLRVLAHQMGLVLQIPAPFLVAASGLPAALVKAVFKAKVPSKQPTSGEATLSRGREAVFVLRKVTAGRVDPTSARYVKLQQSFTNDEGVEAYLAYVKTLRARAHIHINAGAL